MTEKRRKVQLRQSGLCGPVSENICLQTYLLLHLYFVPVDIQKGIISNWLCDILFFQKQM